MEANFGAVRDSEARATELAAALEEELSTKVYIYICIYIYIYVYIYMYIYIHICMYMYVCVGGYDVLILHPPLRQHIDIETYLGYYFYIYA